MYGEKEGKKFVQPSKAIECFTNQVPYWQAEFLRGTGIIYRLILVTAVNSLDFLKNPNNWESRLNLSSLQLELNEKFSPLPQALGQSTSGYQFIQCSCGKKADNNGYGLDLKVKSKALAPNIHKSIFQISFDIHVFEDSRAIVSCNHHQDALDIITRCLKKIPNNYVALLNDLFRHKNCQAQHQKLIKLIPSNVENVTPVKKSIKDNPNDRNTQEKLSGKNAIPESKNSFALLANFSQEEKKPVMAKEKEKKGQENICSSPPLSQPPNPTSNNTNTKQGNAENALVGGVNASQTSNKL